MSLEKIPIIILVSWAFKKCITSPNPPPPKNERVQTNAMEMQWYTQHLPTFATSLQWFAGIMEIVTILAWKTRQFWLSKLLLSFLGGHPTNLRPTMLTTIGAAMIITGTLIRLMTYRHLGKFFRFEASIQKDHQLIVSGPYSIVRHPSYSGLLISHPGWFLWQLGRGSWVRESGLFSTILGKFAVLSYGGLVILGTLYLVLMRMSDEDAALRKRFGKKWDEWAKDVPCAVIPGIY